MVTACYQSGTKDSSPLDLDNPLELNASVPFGYYRALDFVPYAMVGHVSEFFLNGILPFGMLLRVIMVVGFFKGHRFKPVLLKCFFKVQGA